MYILTYLLTYVSMYLFVHTCLLMYLCIYLYLRISYVVFSSFFQGSRGLFKVSMEGTLTRGSSLKAGSTDATASPRRKRPGRTM